MAFSIKTREEKKTKIDFGIVDPALMQDLQDHFCDAHNLYLACISKKHGVITKAYGSREELSYIHNKVDMDMHVSLLNRLIGSNVESVVEMNCNQKSTKMCGIAVRINGDIVAIWVAIGLMEGAGEEFPSYMKCTTEDQFYKSIEFLEVISKHLFTVKQEEHLAQEAFVVSRASESKMEEELRRNGVLTSVVRMLESENEFNKIVDDILKSVGEHLHISNCALMRETSRGDLVDMICEYAETEEDSIIESAQNIAKNALPFFTGKPYMISANSVMPEEFRVFFNRAKLRAGVFLPIAVDGKVGMYLCFLEKKQDKIWDVNDIKFLNDVKRIIQSILIKRIAKNSLASSYASLEAILENVGCGIYVRDAKVGQVLYTNKKYRVAFESAFEEQGVEEYIAAVIESQELYQEFYFEKQEKWFAFQCTQINWIDGRDVELCAIFDVSAKRFYQKKMEKQVSHDLLTGLYNRIRCEQDLEQCVKNTSELGMEGAILYIDLDDFKHINDGLGHQYGDALLQSIAKHLCKIPSVDGNCYRVGGDEFLIIVQHDHYPLLEKIIEEIKELFGKPWLLKGREYYCTMSMSVIRFPTEGDRFDELIKKADAALFNAKNAGKNRVYFYDENHDIGSYKRLDLEKNMRNATQSRMEEFEVFCQPIVDVTQEGTPCIGGEALVRWNSKELGYVSPVDFIPLSEYLGLINPIGTHVLREACKRCKSWNDKGQPDFSINVNLSVVQLLQPDIVDIISEVIKETGIIPDHLHLEVTEGLAINDMSRMKQILADIRALGVKVALDDFGTGYSSLNHIREMPIDIIKIDRCFIEDIEKDDFAKSFVKIVTELANVIGVKTCIEGVESLEQVEILRELNVHFIQGYYFGKPMPLDEFEKKYLIEK